MSEENERRKKAAVQLIRKLTRAGHTALFAGGCVRDALRGVTPKDYDIATDATPDEVLSLFPRGDSIGAHFGVILVRRDGFPFEIATFREDGTYRDGRRPEGVTYSTPERDARRRDFTINGMFLDPLDDRLIDHVGGREDLQDRLLRAIGDPAARFEEDYLRMLRAVRFATVLDFEIEEETWKALRDRSGAIVDISPERIRDELGRVWRHGNRVRGFDLLVESGLMRAILPEILNLRGCEQPPRWHPEGDVFVHTRLMLSLLPPDASLPLVLSVLFHDIAKPATFERDPDGRIRFHGHDRLGAEMTGAILKRLRYSNAVIEATVSGVRHHMQFKDVRDMRTARLKRFMARDTFDDELELHRVDCLGSNGRLENYEFLQTKRDEFAREPLIPPPLLSGKDLIERGMDPGPEFKEILTEAQDAQLEGRLKTREEALEWLVGRLSERE